MFDTIAIIFFPNQRDVHLQVLALATLHPWLSKGNSAATWGGDPLWSQGMTGALPCPIGSSATASKKNQTISQNHKQNAST